MGQPAARVGDMHVCPMMTPGVPPIPHVGGPILPPGAPTVLIGSMPAAVVGGMCVCVGPPDVDGARLVHRADRQHAGRAHGRHDRTRRLDRPRLSRRC